MDGKKEKDINFYIREEAYGWLSNFWRATQIVGKEVYPTNEHYYQSQKGELPSVRDWIKKAPTAYLAMCAGRSLREGKEGRYVWPAIREDIMLKGLRVKFKNHDLRKKLLATGDAIIHEDSPTDMFWGKKGEDMLGKLLMQVREEILEEEKGGHSSPK